MASDKPIRVGIVGLNFGAEFIPIYQAHPDAEMHAICRRDQAGWTSAETSSASRPGTGTSPT